MSFFSVMSVLVVLLSGSIITWLMLRYRYEQKIEQVKLQSEHERNTLAERLVQKEANLIEVSERSKMLSQKIDELTLHHQELIAERAELKTRLEHEQKFNVERLRLLKETEEQLKNTFKAMSQDALQSNNAVFIQLAQSILGRIQEGANAQLEKREHTLFEILKPLKESLEKVDHKVFELEKTRAGAYEGLTQQITSLLQTQKDLKSETANLVRALRMPHVRGRWGEMQLRRVVEMAGMIAHCDFYEQAHQQNDDEVRRPDMLIRLPGGKNIVVDAKTPLTAFIEAVETSDEILRVQKLKDHAQQVKRHIQMLSQKSYWQQFEPSPEFVLLFLPGETFYSAALEHDPSLIEAGVAQRVILATPTTLIALLRAIAYGWRQDSIAENALEISELGRTLYKRLADLSGYIAELGQKLKQTVNTYNKTVGNFESRVLVAARRFEELQVDDLQKSLQDSKNVETVPRMLNGAEAIDHEVGL